MNIRWDSCLACLLGPPGNTQRLIGALPCCSLSQLRFGGGEGRKRNGGAFVHLRRPRSRVPRTSASDSRTSIALGQLDGRNRHLPPPIRPLTSGSITRAASDRVPLVLYSRASRPIGSSSSCTRAHGVLAQPPHATSFTFTAEGDAMITATSPMESPRCRRRAMRIVAPQLRTAHRTIFTCTRPR